MRRQAPTVTEICEFVWKTEERLDLLEWKVDDAHPWVVFRMVFYYWLTQRVGTLDRPHPTQVRSRKDLLKFGFLAARSSVFKNPFLNIPAGNAVLIPATRKIAGVDIYSEQLVRELGGSLSTLEVWGQDAGDSSSSLDGAVLGAVLGAAWRRRWADIRNCRETRALMSEVRQRFEVDVTDLGARLATSHSRFLSLRTVMRRLFRIKQPSHLYVVAAYNRMYATAAAGDCGIRVTELQHGTMGPYHLGYSYPGSPRVPYMPDELLVFGKYWVDSTPLPSNLTTRVIGASYVTRLAQEHQSTKERDMIVFSSQGVIGKKLFDFALTAASLLPHRRIVFRLHPSERREDYEGLLTGRGAPPNFSISHQTPNIFALLAAADIQAGVFSTTLFEGMVLGTKVILLDMPGVEYMRAVAERGDAIIVKTPAEFAERVNDAVLVRDWRYYYDTPVDRIVPDMVG